MLIYSGDVDACVPYYGTETWTRELGFELKQGWRTWNAGTEDKPQSQCGRALLPVARDAPLTPRPRVAPANAPVTC